MKINSVLRVNGRPVGLWWVWGVCLASVLGGLGSARGGQVDRWLADDLTGLNEGDAVGSWTSQSNRTATGSIGLQPTFRKNASPAGGPAVRFNQSFMTVGDSPLGGATAFSIALVFKPSAVGATGANWYQCTGLVDAEQGGVTVDWGTVLDASGHVAVGTGSPDTTTFSSGASLVDGNFHVAVFTWGGGAQSVYVDSGSAVTQTGVGTAARMNAGFAFGGILTTEGGAARRFIGDLVEARFYNTNLGATEVSNLIQQLTDTHLNGTQPVIRSFAAVPGQVPIGTPVTLAWNVRTNATGLFIDHGVGAISSFTNSVLVWPRTNTTYTLTASNAFGIRTAQATVLVDQGIPAASNLTVSTVLNTSKDFFLTGSDPQGSNLAFTVVSGPLHGSLAGTPPSVTYTPAPDYLGNDQFTFTVNDGEFDSAPGTVTLRVLPPPAPPSAVVLSSTNLSSTVVPGGFIATLRAVDPNPEDTHTFTLTPGFGDNGMFVIHGNLLLAGPTFIGGAGAAFSIQVRATDSTGLWLEQTFALRVADNALGIVINEIHYNPADNTSREEFIELYNPSAVPVDLSLWRLTSAVDYTFAAGTVIAAGGFAVVAEDPPTLLARYDVSALGPWAGGLSSAGERVQLVDANNQTINEVNYTSEFPWPIGADGGGGSMALVNPALDNDLGSSWRTENPPTPGAINRAFATNAPPNIRQVQHTPQSPASADPIVITAKVTDPDGVAAVVLKYQIVTPGNYLSAITPIDINQLNPLTNPNLEPAANPQFENAANWITVPMADDGTGGDAVAGDGIYSATVPPQANRVLVRYRILVTDTRGASRQAPFEDDPSLNFACFVYDGIPAYAGSSSAVMQTLPVYFLLTRAADFSTCEGYTGTQLNQFDNSGAVANEGRYVFNWEGAFVYEGEVYDHVRYRLEGANGRYQVGRRSFSLKFNDGRNFSAKDLDGKPYPYKWGRINLAKGQSNRETVTFSLNEAMTYFLCNKVGVPGPLTHYLHWRVVRTPQEQPDLYSGDFYGVFMLQENYDVRFLDTHGLGKGNLYKLINAPRALPPGGNADMLEQQRYQAQDALTNAQDAVNAQAKLIGTNPVRDSASLLAYVNYPKWDRYHAICETTRDYDFWPDANKNAAWYFEPAYGASNAFGGRMWTLPWDATDTWGPTWNSGQDMCYAGLFNSAIDLDLQTEYFNTLREVRDLLIQPDQINPMLDALAAKAQALMPANLIRWSNAPTPGSSYLSMPMPGPALTGGLAAYVQDMKDFLFLGGTRAWWVGGETIAAGGWAVARLDARAADAAIPTKPTLTYTGPTNYPVTGLSFQSSAFADLQGAGTFAAMQWRVAEITPTNTPVSSPSDLKFEWDAVWESGELTAFTNQMRVPAIAVLPGHVYRARVRHKDNTGRWSNWSAPLQFVPSPVDLVSDLQRFLVVSEIMYHPPDQAGIDGTAFEFLELKNAGSTVLDLSGLSFTSGITFMFTNGTLLAPGQFFVLGRDLARLQSKYPSLIVNGLYKGKLSNAGDTLTLTHPFGVNIFSVTYGTRGSWPVAADGFGFSLVPDETNPGHYRASNQAGGSPGADDPVSVLPRVVINEILSSSVPPALDAIEVYNPTANVVDLGGWYLTDNATYPWKYRIPAGTLLPPGCYLVFDETQFNPTPGQGTSFALSALGEEVYLFSADPAQGLTGYSHGFAFGGAARGETFGRYFNSVGEEQFPPQVRPTLGTNNVGPRVGSVVINQIQYHPDTNSDEFVELLNRTSSPVPFFDPVNPTNTWQLSGVGFTFPTGVTLDPGGLMLVVATSPAVFRSKYNVPAQVQIFGPVPGHLQHGGERLELRSPDQPETNGAPYFTVDAVRYDNKAPWPSIADGWGAALRRKHPAEYGDDPANWSAVVPAPGLALTSGTVPTILTPPASRSAVAYSDLALSVAAAGSAPLAYQWQYNGGNLAGATNAALVLTNLQMSQAGSYAVWVYNQAGSVLSAPAVLTLALPAIITGQPQTVSTNPGATVSFTVAATGTGSLSYQWRCNGTNLPGATSATLTLTNVQLAQNGAYSALVTDAISTVSSQPAWLIVLVKPIPTQGPSNMVAAVGEPVVLTASASGTLPMGARWRKNNGTYVDYVTLPGNVASLTFSNIALSNAGFYTAVFSNYAAPSPSVQQESAKGYLTVVVPPTNQLVAAGATAALPAVNGGMVLRYFAWECNGAALLRGTNQGVAASATNTLSVTNLQASGVGYYTYFITNAALYYVTNGSVITTNWMALGSPRGFTVYLGIAQPGAPVIVLDPTNQLVLPGATAILSVLAGGSAPLSYQWYLNTLNTTNLLAGQTNAGLVVSNIQPTQLGWYRVVVTNSAGRVTSRAAELFFTSTDSDHDGVPDWAELLAGTDPQDPSSYLKVDAMPAGTNLVTLRFMAVSNRTYSVVNAAETHPPLWTVLTNVAAAPTNRQVQVTNIPASASQRFYRLVTPQLP